MYFLLQKEQGKKIPIELIIVQQLLDESKLLHQYEFCSVKDLSDKNFRKQRYDIENMIPIGSIEFVNTYLKQVHGVTNMNPIEVPKCLRKEEFLKREYHILREEELPKTGEYFIKDVSRLKTFTYAGNIENIHRSSVRYLNSNEQIKLDKTHFYQLSEIIDIKSEYRAYFIDGNLQAVVNYNGDPWLMPDMQLLQKANNIYYMQKDYPNSYTMDIAVMDRGTCILEIHPFTSVGLYHTIWGTNLLYAYRDGIDYYLTKNTKTE